MTDRADTKHFWCSSSGLINLEMSKAEARSASHSGACDDDVRWLSQQLAIVSQLDSIDPIALAKELRECGAWDETELANHDQNLQRLVWLAAGDIADGNF